MEIEHPFHCPVCNAAISVLIDTSGGDQQNWVEDCEVCCHPLQLVALCRDGEVLTFSAAEAGA